MRRWWGGDGGGGEGGGSGTRSFCLHYCVRADRANTPRLPCICISTPADGSHSPANRTPTKKKRDVETHVLQEAKRSKEI